MILIAIESFNATGIMFHISNFAQEQSIPIEEIFKAFLPITILTLIFTPLVSKIYQYIRLRVMLFLIVFIQCFVNFFLLKLSNWIFVWLFIIFNSLTWGIHHVLSYTLVSCVLHEKQRAIGYSTLIGFSSLCSAIGPFVYSCLFTFFGSYTAVGHVMLVLNLLIALWILYICRYTKLLKHYDS
jgi:MFS family permease